MTFASQGVWQTLHDLISGGRPAVLVTIIGTQGSVPREPGTRMIVCADGGFFGTIGGGTLEFDAIRDARGLLERGDTQSVLETRSLGPDLGQCCGGRVRLLLEVFCDAAQTTHLVDAARLGSFATTTTHKPGMRLARQVIPATGHQSGVIEDGDTLIETFISDQQPVALFGNGHVGRALVLALGALPFRVIWLDGRAEDFPKAVPGNCTPVHMGDPREAVQALPRGTHVMVMTHSHPLDLAVCSAALARADLPFVGLIGSKTKRARFRSQLQRAGYSAETLDRLVCPIGVGSVRSKLPAAIAASIAVQLLEWREHASACLKLADTA